MKSTKKYQYDHPRAGIAVDCVIFGFYNDSLKLLLIDRSKNIIETYMALPGGFLRENETAENCAKRILIEKTGLKNIFTEQLYTFTEINRDPRERIVSIAYFALIDRKQYESVTEQDSIKANWVELTKVPRLAFDHNKIVKMAAERLKGKVRYQPIGFELLEEKFTLSQLQKLYEAILGIPIDKRNFRKKLLKMNLLDALDDKQKNVAHKAARFYRFNEKSYKQLTKTGFNFEV